MNEDVTRVLRDLEDGDPHAADKLLPLVYDELRKLAAQRLAREAPGQTLEATALVHEAYLRLVGSGEAAPHPQPLSPKGRGESDDQPLSPKGRAEQHWDHRGHFFAAAAEAMRRILVDNARRRQAVKHGGGRRRVELADHPLARQTDPARLLALDEALTRLAAEDGQAAAVVKLHFFAGLPMDEVAGALRVSRATVYRQWTYARAWLRCAINAGSDD